MFGFSKYITVYYQRMNGRLRRAVRGSIREIVFGLEDSLVSTLGAVTGIAAGAQSTFIVILSGLVLIAVESASMAAGSYLSSEAAADRRPLRAAWVMGLCYILGGFVPLLPYVFLPIRLAYIPSIVLTALALLLVGVWRAEFTKHSRLRSGIEMVVVSLGAALIGYLIGRAVGVYLHIEIPS